MKYVKNPPSLAIRTLAFDLFGALGNAKRGAVAVAMWDAKVPRPAFRVYLESPWEHDHGYVIEAAGTRRSLAAMFGYAAFALPDFIWETVSVRRGTSGVAAALARTGYSWKLDRAMACWFAMLFASPARTPPVLLAEVPREAIALYTNEREKTGLWWCAHQPPAWTA
ncbi:hypothetical protein [Paraburkholderia flagellata]|uniref:hypothetical protein n=1 Tax=Paraburkholderia flagellata TaxID=2883241 RepID=UPI001F17C901|nr:hypothetical protein [Paraburkholderia flagellata]